MTRHVVRIGMILTRGTRAKKDTRTNDRIRLVYGDEYVINDTNWIAKS